MRIRPMNDLFLLRLLAPAAVAGLSVLLAVPLLARGREPMPAEDLQRTGVIHGWRLETDGTLYFALQSQGWRFTSNGIPAASRSAANAAQPCMYSG